MTVIRTGAFAEKEQAEKAKINAANAKRARMTNMKSRMSNLQLKIECMIKKTEGKHNRLQRYQR